MSNSPRDPDRQGQVSANDRTTHEDAQTIGETEPRRTDHEGDPVRGDRRTESKTDDPTAGGRTDGDDGDILKWLSGIVSLVGAWIVASPFVYGASEIATWNNVAVGAAIFLIAGFSFYRSMEVNRPDVGAAGLLTVLGLWLIVAPFVLFVGSEAFGWSTLVSGVVVAILSGYIAYESRQTEAETTAETRA